MYTDKRLETWRITIQIGIPQSRQRNIFPGAGHGENVSWMRPKAIAKGNSRLFAIGLKTGHLDRNQKK